MRISKDKWSRNILWGHYVRGGHNKAMRFDRFLRYCNDYAISIEPLLITAPINDEGITYTFVKSKPKA